MKLRKWAAVAALLAMPVAFSVLAEQMGTDGRRIPGQNSGSSNPAQPIVVGGIDRSDTSFMSLTLDGDGYLRVVDQSRDRNLYRTGTLINNQLGASGNSMADSSGAPIPTYDLKRTGLFFYGTFDSLSTVVRVAVQVRAHFNANNDSISTFPWLRWGVNSVNSGAPAAVAGFSSKRDSIGHGDAPTAVPVSPVQATSANSSFSGLLPGEFLVIFNVAREDTASAQTGKPWSLPKGFYVPLVGAQGEWFWAPYMSVRVRVINGVRNRFRIRVDYAGTAL